jgi:hypothetical protein
VSYTWYCDGTEVGTGKSLTITSAKCPVGSTLKVKAKAFKEYYHSYSSTSSKCTVKKAYKTSGTLSVSGIAEDGVLRIFQNLKASVSGVTSGAKVAYKWTCKTGTATKTVSSKATYRVNNSGDNKCQAGSQLQVAATITKDTWESTTLTWGYKPVETARTVDIEKARFADFLEVGRTAEVVLEGPDKSKVTTAYTWYCIDSGGSRTEVDSGSPTHLVTDNEKSCQFQVEVKASREEYWSKTLLTEVATPAAWKIYRVTDKVGPIPALTSVAVGDYVSVSDLRQDVAGFDDVPCDDFLDFSVGLDCTVQWEAGVWNGSMYQWDWSPVGAPSGDRTLSVPATAFGKKLRAVVVTKNTVKGTTTTRYSSVVDVDQAGKLYPAETMHIEPVIGASNKIVGFRVVDADFNCDYRGKRVGCLGLKLDTTWTYETSSGKRTATDETLHVDWTTVRALSATVVASAFGYEPAAVADGYEIQFSTGKGDGCDGDLDQHGYHLCRLHLNYNVATEYVQSYEEEESARNQVVCLIPEIGYGIVTRDPTVLLSIPGAGPLPSTTVKGNAQAAAWTLFGLICEDLLQLLPDDQVYINAKSFVKSGDRSKLLRVTTAWTVSYIKGKAARYRFEIVEPTSGNQPDPSWFFQDVSATAAFHNEITYLTDKGVVGRATEFHPDRALTRAEAAAYLYRVKGSPSFSLPAVPTFSDVPKDDVGRSAIEWVSSQGLIKGSGKEFQPSKTVTRAELMVYLYRLAGSQDVSGVAKASFSDIDTTPHGWAISWAVSAKLTSNSTGTFHPNRAVTRAEAAAVLARYLTNGVGS